MSTKYLCYVEDLQYFLQDDQVTYIEDISESKKTHLFYHNYDLWKDTDLFYNIKPVHNMKVYNMFLQNDGLHILIGW